jgi:hypothetical protein
MYYIYLRRTGEFVRKTTSVDILKAFSSDRFEVVIY